MKKYLLAGVLFFCFVSSSFSFDFDFRSFFRGDFPSNSFDFPSGSLIVSSSDVSCNFTSSNLVSSFDIFYRMFSGVNGGFSHFSSPFYDPPFNSYDFKFLINQSLFCFRAIVFRFSESDFPISSDSFLSSMNSKGVGLTTTPCFASVSLSGISTSRSDILWSFLGSYDGFLFFVANLNSVSYSGNVSYYFTFPMFSSLFFDFCFLNIFTSSSVNFISVDPPESDDGNVSIDFPPPGDLIGCVCGACCSDRCVCGKWEGKKCAGFLRNSDGSLMAYRTMTGFADEVPGLVFRCFHGCPGPDCYHVRLPDSYSHCECHHVQHGESYQFGSPPLELARMPPHSEWPDLFGLFVPQLPELPNEFEPPVIPPGLPGFTLPYSVLPGFGELSIPESPSDFELDFFVYEGGFPIFKFESMYEKFLGEFNEKIDLSLYDSLGSGGQAEQLAWNINHTIMGVTFGPYTINFSDLISNAKGFSGIDIIRNVLVFILYTLFIYFIFRMLFF